MNQPPQSTRKILLIEDDAFIGELYVRALNKAGYSVTIVSDGQQGFTEAMSNTYDIVLLDLILPNMHGMEILTRLRKEKPDLKAKIVITTNLEDSKEHQAAIENQADAYLIKADITPSQLIDFLSHIK